MDLFSNIKTHKKGVKSRDLLVDVYGYFLSGVAGDERRHGGEFFTQPSVMRVMVEMLEPYRVNEATWPASTFRILPVDLNDASDAKKYTPSAISSENTDRCRRERLR